MRILIANRGEIAIRVIDAAHRLGHTAVAVYSDADVDAPHVHAADDALRIGAAPANASYLNIAALIEAARRAGADAVHPGYGFLSENADFAAAVLDAGLVFVGPSPDVVRLMGDKAAAKRRLAHAGVPLLPGYQGSDAGDARLLAESERIGFPIMVKAAAGGGGKGMRLVTHADALPAAISAARRESLSAFGSDVLILERALLTPRHVEIQILADRHGNVVAVGERDCSVQRRHQKVVEEAPSPALDADLRSAMATAAVTAARDIGYVGAGTVEFLLDTDGTFAFLEMNTRIQVEHPVTELISGIDLVAWQLRIADGEELDFTQDEVTLTGHAMEARLYAEDADFLPSAGVIECWIPPTGPGIRVDAGITTGSVVTPYYDPMLAKIIAHGRSREEARRRLVRALRETTALGIETNRGFLIALLSDPRFVSGAFDTSMLAQHTPRPPSPDDAVVGGVAEVLWQHTLRDAAQHSPGLAGWRSDRRARVRRTLAVAGDTHTVEIGHHPTPVFHVDGRPVDTPARARTGIVIGDRVLAHFPDIDVDSLDETLAPPAAASEAASGQLNSPLHGAVTTIAVATGDRVVDGDLIAIVEAMKMEHEIRASISGIIEIQTVVGAQVASGDELARIVADDTTGGHHG